MKKSLFKYLIRKIKKNLAGFITISLIVTLGVGFLVGLLITTSVLQTSVDALYDSSNMSEITLKSTVGFDDTSLETIKNKFGDDIAYIEGSYQMDQHVIDKEENIAARVIYYNFESEINKIEILEGNIPNNEFECIVEKHSTFYKNFAIGDTIIIDENEYKVSGIAANPQYFSNEKEFTTISPGRLDTIIYLNNKFNTNDFYTDISIVFKDGYKYNSFSDEYFDFIDEKIKLIEEDKNVLIEERLANLKLTIEEEVSKAIKEELVSRFGESLAEELMKSEQIKSEIETIVQDQIKNLNPDVYILDRNDNISFYMYKLQSVKTNEVAIVFPFFFIAIATLITLSTLERMIKEDRIYIGTLKSLGYGKGSITGVYTLYSLIATLVGVGVGTLVGVFALPAVIYFIFSTLYLLPPIIFGFDFLVFFITAISITFAVTLATVLTLVTVLKEKPNALMTQKPIKSGGKILVERIKCIWNRLKFKHKSTVRNLFRFKKNALMMIIGVAGSTALVVGAFGMLDSISDVTSTQYNEIVLYNTLVEVNDYTIDPFEDFPNVEKQDVIYRLQGVAADNNEYELEIIAPYEDTNLNEYINFIKDGNKVEFNEDSMFISSQLSEVLGIGVDDVFFFNVNNKQYSVLVNGVVENHLSNYIYMSEYSLKNIFKDVKAPNCYIGVANNISTQEEQDKFITELSKNDNVSSVILTYQNKETYENLLGTLEMVIVVLILFAGALEITSIYSLTNINISERNREIATLKVLGYKRGEVVGYIYRETSILAVIGTLFGFLLGYLFHKFLIVMLVMPGLSIGSVISPLSYLLAFVISLAFFAIVDLMFFPRINNLSMIESLKSVE